MFTKHMWTSMPAALQHITFSNREDIARQVLVEKDQAEQRAREQHLGSLHENQQKAEDNKSKARAALEKSDKFTSLLKEEED